MLRTKRPEMKAIVISASQKTLPVALAVITFLPDSLGDQGQMGIACVIAHLVQVSMLAASCPNLSLHTRTSRPGHCWRTQTDARSAQNRDQWSDSKPHESVLCLFAASQIIFDSFIVGRWAKDDPIECEEGKAERDSTEMDGDVLLGEEATTSGGVSDLSVRASLTSVV